MSLGTNTKTKGMSKRALIFSLIAISLVSLTSYASAAYILSGASVSNIIQNPTFAAAPTVLVFNSTLGPTGGQQTLSDGSTAGTCVLTNGGSGFNCSGTALMAGDSYEISGTITSPSGNPNQSAVITYSDTGSGFTSNVYINSVAYASQSTATINGGATNAFQAQVSTTTTSTGTDNFTCSLTF